MFTINKFHAHNYRGIEHIDVDFQPGVNLIIGENGSGKTSLVSAIHSWLSETRGLIGIGGGGIDKKDVFQTSKLSGDVTAQIMYHYPVTIGGSINWDDQDFSYDRILEDEGGHESVSDYECMRKFKELAEETESRFPLFAYFSVARKYDKVGLDNIGLTQKTYDRLDGYKNCFDDANEESFRDAESWCIKMEMTEFQKKQPISEYKKFKDTVIKFLKEIAPEYQIKDIYFSMIHYTLVIVQEDGSEIPVAKMSDGLKYLYGLIVELIFRASILNPQEDAKISETTGVVIIDEVDVHLHPRWQWKIVDVLQSVFPKIQFVLSTHSPMVISSAKDSNIIVLENPNKAIYRNDIYGSSTEDVLSYVQNSKSYPTVIQDIYDTLQSYLEKEDIPGAENALDEIAKKYGVDSAEDRAAQKYYDINKWIGENIDDFN